MTPVVKTAAALAMGSLIASASPAAAQPDTEGAVTVEACVGPRVQAVVQGNYRRHIPDRIIGDTPTILASPGGRRMGMLTAGTAYVVAGLRGGYALLRATRFSNPFSPETNVGWVRLTEILSLPPRNCV